MKVHWAWHVLGPTVSGAILGITIFGPIGALWMAAGGALLGLGFALLDDERLP